ncbi:probable sphingolipid transporter spinster homolog 1 isoform X1 [Amphibalanus amphitrite]|uniref:probable sphingolipid transporter spinster homolog 1 isoform X1 n=1 Tax=Amphibalanus amphitrite TaxID=1232801 RepID=UPI001C9128F9|nr:probable sphingolipid transporter spinster homolog 1 isoform X1 [Amphibalanus amphitrite]XP_043217545.1 probable sphingolipid transporter spinster homolog 1 isoform X2 [Amphibalanus amphitrite]XP_043217546.1 probable sphingolipid transporter spinster homolog 1 isoform X1 [Amphibalanus amphitrite]
MWGRSRPGAWYRWYHLALMTATYITGELSHFLVGIVSRQMAQELHYGDIGCVERENATDAGADCYTFTDNTSCTAVDACEWTYTGLGIQYQVLAGPAFIGAFTLAGLVFGSLADSYNRQRLLTFSTALLTVSTFLMGFATEYWHLVLFRMCTAAGEAGFAPLSSGMISDQFPPQLRGMAMSIFTWGIYFGYGISYAIGNYVSAADIMGQSWRWAYYVAAIPGAVLCCLHLTAHDPRTRQAALSDGEHDLYRIKTSESEAAPVAAAEAAEGVGPRAGWWSRFVVDKLRVFLQPSILLLLLGASMRHTAGFCWSTNTQLYFQTYYPTADLGLWLSWVSIVGGSIGVTVGGVVSDRLVKRIGLRARIWVLSASQLVATPFAVGVLYFPPQWCFVSLLTAYLFAEMWFGVVLAIVVELVEPDVKSSTVAIFLFIINNVGGNMPLAVDGLGDVIGYRDALYVLYPGMYFASSVVFLLTAFALRRDGQPPAAAQEEMTES